MAEPPSSRALPWQAVVATTVLAFLAASGVFFLLSDNGDDDRATDGTLELQPLDGDATDEDPLTVPFTMQDGETGSLADLVGDRPMVVNFFASWCPPCIEEMPDFESVSEELEGQVRFVGLAVQDRPEDAERIVEQTGISYEWFRDIRGDIVAATGVVQMPTTMLIDEGGEIVEIQPGALDATALRALIAEHLGIST